MKSFQNILLLKIAAVILLHSLIPHRHHREMSTTEHKTAHINADDLIDYLSLAFHSNFFGDFENYIAAERLSPNRTIAGASRFAAGYAASAKKSSSEAERLFEAVKAFDFKRADFRSKRMRAPPSAIIIYKSI